MKILILGLNYAPEPVGIGPYTAGMAEALAAAGHDVTVVCGKPFYPAWKVDPDYAGALRRSIEADVKIIRLSVYVPAVPTGRRRLMHHASFAVRAQVIMLAEARRLRPDVIIAIAPSLVSTIAARNAARAVGAKLWLHIQDFEVEAAFATGLLAGEGLVARTALRFENWSLKADRISTISPQMCHKLVAKGVAREKVVEFRNWAATDLVKPLSANSHYRLKWGIDRPHIALYSGNIANKQGIEIIVEAARLLAGRTDLMFIVCGEGPNLDVLKSQAYGLDNIVFHDLQPAACLSDLLGLATVHLLPQIASAADLVLPSKLGNMLASGRPVVVTAHPGTGLAYEVEGVGLISEPENGPAFAAAIVELLDHPELRESLGRAARQRAEHRWSKSRILRLFERQLLACATET